MQVYTDTYTITAGTVPAQIPFAVGTGTGQGYAVVGATTYGSVNTTMKVRGSDVVLLAAEGGGAGRFHLQLEHRLGNSGFYRIKIANTYFYRHEATYNSSSVHGISYWTWAFNTDPVFVEGETSTVEIEYHQELVGEALILQGYYASQTALDRTIYGYNTVSPDGTTGTLYGTIDDIYSTSTIKSLKSVVSGTHEHLELIVSGEQPNSGWDTLQVDTLNFRRRDAEYLTYTNQYSGDVETRWFWVNLLKAPITTSSALATSKRLFVNFYTLDRDLEKFIKSETELYSGFIQPIESGSQFYGYNPGSTGNIKRNWTGISVGTTRFGLANHSIEEIKWNPFQNKFTFKIYQPQTSENERYTEIDYIKVNETYLHVKNANLNTISGNLITYEWENVSTNPWDSEYYPVEIDTGFQISAGYVPIEVGQYDRTVYLDGYTEDNGQSLSHSPTFRQRELVKVFLKDRERYTEAADPAPGLAPTISGLPTGTNYYTLGDYSAILFDFRDVSLTGSSQTFSAFTITVPAAGGGGTVTVTPTIKANPSTTSYKNPITQVLHLTSDSQGNVVAESETLTRYTYSTAQSYTWRTYISTDMTVPQSLRREIYRNTNGTHAIVTGTVDNILYNTGDFSYYRGVHDTFGDIAIDDEDKIDSFIDYQHNYLVGGIVNYSFSNSIILKYPTDVNTLWGLALRNPAGELRLTAEGRIPRVERVITGSLSYQNYAISRVVLAGNFDNYNFRVAQIYPDSEYGALINSSGDIEVVESTAGFTGSQHQQGFGSGRVYAILVFKV